MKLNFGIIIPYPPTCNPHVIVPPLPFRFFIDHDQGIVYFYPPAPITTGSVFLSLAPSAVVANGISGFPPISPRTCAVLFPF
jgi:hypothetical protein